MKPVWEMLLYARQTQGVASVQVETMTSKQTSDLSVYTEFIQIKSVKHLH